MFTHEGGLERIHGRTLPGGISLPMWDDQRLLELAAAYERATHLRRPPATVK